MSFISYSLGVKLFSEIQRFNTRNEEKTVHRRDGTELEANALYTQSET